jgi:hypothetical protein
LRGRIQSLRCSTISRLVDAGIHGEDYYEEAKSTRNLAEHALLVADKAVMAAPDPFREMAAANQILTSIKPKKTTIKSAVKAQLNLFS